VNFDAALCLAEALAGQRRYEEAETTAASLADLAPTDLDRARVALARRVNLFLGLARTEEAQVMLRQTADSVTDYQLAARLRAEEAVVAAYSGRLAEARRLGEAVLALPDLDRVVRWRALSSAGPAWAYSGRTEEALAATDAALAEAIPVATDNPEVIAWLGTVRLTTLFFAGRLDEAAALVDAAEAFQPVGVHLRSSAWLALGRGKLELLLGHPASAARWMRDAVPALCESDPGHLLPWCRSVLAEACSLTGHMVIASEVLADAHRAPVWGLPEGDVRRAGCWIAAGLGELSRARREAIDAADWAHRDGQIGMELHAVHDALRLGAVVESTPRLLELAPAVDGMWPGPFASHARARMEKDADGLLEAATAFETMRADLLAAEAAAEAAALLGPDRRRGRQAAARANRLASACEGAITPALLTTGPAARLTRREEEIVRLAAGGLSNRDIAERLVVSVRTVEGHLLRAYVKLGVQTREELTAVLGPSPPAENA
jgi:ATP/maltotriose-dependent transcriptional regulator MalT